MICKLRLYLTADKAKAVPEGHKDAATLYASPGDEIPASAAERFGLKDGGLPEKAAKAPVDKAAKAPANKGGKAPANKGGKAPANKGATPPAPPAAPEGADADAGAGTGEGEGGTDGSGAGGDA